MLFAPQNLPVRYRPLVLSCRLATTMLRPRQFGRAPSPDVQLRDGQDLEFALAQMDNISNGFANQRDGNR